MFNGIIRKTIEKCDKLGCIADSYLDLGFVMATAETITIEDMLVMFSQYYGKKLNDIVFCDGLNEFRINRLENSDDEVASLEELKDFNEHRICLWDANYYLEIKECSNIDGEVLELALNCAKM